MRRNKQALSQEECEQVLRRATSGVLSLISPDGFPYGVPLSYALVDGVIVFHGALEGQKIDCIRRDNRASFCVVDADDVIPEKYTTAYRSVIVKGRIAIVTDEKQKHDLCIALAKRFYPDESAAEVEYTQFASRLCLMVLTPEQITGKMGLELMRRKEQAQ